jgi:hypothetical protein
MRQMDGAVEERGLLRMDTGVIYWQNGKSGTCHDP